MSASIQVNDGSDKIEARTVVGRGKQSLRNGPELELQLLLNREGEGERKRAKAIIGMSIKTKC